MKKFIEYDKNKLIMSGYDLAMIARTQPEGNIKIHSGYIEYGNCYITFLNVYKFPKHGMPYFWLSSLVNQENVIAYLSVGTENTDEVRPNLNQAIREQTTRVNDQHLQPSDQMDAQLEKDQLIDLYLNLSSNNETLKKMFLRLMVYDSSLPKLLERVEDIRQSFFAFSMGRFIDEQEFELQSIFKPISEQEKMPNHRKGKMIESYDLGGSYPFNYTKLSDPGGTYFGYTNTNGEFTFNPYYLVGSRNRAFTLVAGNSGKGKSTLQQMLNDDAFERGHHICNFDVSGEYRQSTRRQNGLIIDTSQSGNRINMFEVFPTVTNADGEVDEVGSFNQNVDKIKAIAHIMSPELNLEDLAILDTCITDFYKEKGLYVDNPKKNLDKIKLLNLPHDQYPLLEEFVDMLEDKVSEVENSITTSTDELKSLKKLRRSFSSMQSKYSDIFDVHTDIDELSNEKVITFDMSGLKGRSNNNAGSLFQAQFFSYLSLIASNVVINGSHYREMLKNHQIIDDKLGYNIDFYYISIDEAEDYFSVQHPDVVSMLANIMEEMRKNFCAITFTFPNLADILVDPNKNTQHEDYVTAVGKIFGLFQYFHIFNSPNGDVEALKNYFNKNQTVNQDQLDTLVNLKPHEVLTIIDGEKSYRWTTSLSEDQLDRYR